MTKFQYFKQPISNVIPDGWVSLDRFLLSTVSPKPEIKTVFGYIEEAAKAGNDKLKAELKQKHLHYFTPCVHLDGRRNYKSITRFTGLLVLDFDKIDNAADFKRFLYYEYPEIIAAWLSPSRKGIKALVNIPIVETVEEFKEYFFGIAAEMEIYDGFDGTAQNPTQPLFQSWDEQLLYKTDPGIWEQKGERPGSLQFQDPIELPDIEVTEDLTQRVINITTAAINNISDVGHWGLRGTALALGGYCAAGYITTSDATSLLDSLIDSHPYLQQKSNTYKKTARWGIEKGMNKPIIL
jgi:hypothetical protein